jgi:hypothetical protein
MLETEHSVTLLTIMEIAGPIILAGGLIYGIFFASRRRRDQKRAAMLRRDGCINRRTTR